MSDDPNQGTTVSVADLLHQNQLLRDALQPFANQLNANWQNARATQKVQISVYVGDLRVAAYALGQT